MLVAVAIAPEKTRRDPTRAIRQRPKIAQRKGRDGELIDDACKDWSRGGAELPAHDLDVAAAPVQRVNASSNCKAPAPQQETDVALSRPESVSLLALQGRAQAFGT